MYSHCSMCVFGKGENKAVTMLCMFCPQALEILGLKPTVCQVQNLRERLYLSPDGTVAYGGKNLSLGQRQIKVPTF